MFALLTLVHLAMVFIPLLGLTVEALWIASQWVYRSQQAFALDGRWEVTVRGTHRGAPVRAGLTPDVGR